jgi:hypothetical protein
MLLLSEAGAGGRGAVLTPWFELGAYLPLYTLTRDGRFLIDGTKLRALFVSPNAAERDFWYGVNFELSYNARHWEEARYALEIRPILGWRFGPVDLLLNPIIDLPFHGGPGTLTFAPADRIAYNLSETWALAVEHYADFGRFANFEPLSRQYHALYGVIDYTRGPVERRVQHRPRLYGRLRTIDPEADPNPQLLTSIAATPCGRPEP